jgi:predicted nucleic acid-binding Zn ribbon protein
MRNVPPMSARTCVVCGQDITSWARVDKTTCGPACRSRLSRSRKASCNTFATPLSAMAPRSGGGEGGEPVRGPIAPPGASREPGRAAALSIVSGSGAGSRPSGVVYPDRLVRVLAEGLRTIEERRARGQTELPNRAIIVPPSKEEPTDEPAPEP